MSRTRFEAYGDRIMAPSDQPALSYDHNIVGAGQFFEIFPQAQFVVDVQLVVDPTTS